MNPVKPKTLVLTYFEAFGGDELNSSRLLAQDVLKLSWPDLNFRSLELPVAFEEASYQLDQFLAQGEWDALLMLGQAGRRKKMSLELAARNIVDPRFPDNRGRSPKGKIADDLPEQLFTSWPFEEMIASLSSAHWELSKNAGEYVCNELFFRQLMPQREKWVGFVHIPLLSPQPDFALSLREATEHFAQFLRICLRELHARS